MLTAPLAALYADPYPGGLLALLLLVAFTVGVCAGVLATCLAVLPRRPAPRLAADELPPAAPGVERRLALVDPWRHAPSKGTSA